MSTISTPPAVNVWDHEAITADALAILGLGATDPAAPTVAGKVTEATALIDVEWDRVEPVDTATHPTWTGAAATLAVALYRRKDASTGMLTGYSPDAVPFNVPADPLDLVRTQISDGKQRWGVA